MSGLAESWPDWYTDVWDYTLRLVKIRSVSPGEGENEVAEEVYRLLCADGLDALYSASGLDAVERDVYGRQNVYAFLRGESATTLVLLGHFDTVDTQDYGPLEPWALDPLELAARRAHLGLEPGLATNAEDWLFGRGVIDMKCGVAANIAVLRRLAEEARAGRLSCSIVFLATPDEENESAGVLQGVRLLLRLREQYGLTYVGAINTDYTTALYPGDPQRYIYAGTVGKLLPCFLCIGRESHVGAPFNGIDANLLAAELIRDLSMNDALCDQERGQLTAPPVTLHATDLKAHYDVQLPFAAYFYLNVLTLTTGPGALLERLRHYAEVALARCLARIDATEARWRAASRGSTTPGERRPRTGVVLTYAELHAETVQRLGEVAVAAELAAEEERLPDSLDKRERCLQLAQRLWRLSGRQGPAVVLFYAPPYYPHIAATPCPLHEAVASVVDAHADLNLVLREYYPYLSDMSYLRLEPDMDLSAFTANMPIWEEPSAAPRPGAYSLPLEAIKRLGLPVINFGPYGQGAHQRDEAALTSYSFGTLPQLLYETVAQLGRWIAG